MKQVITKSFLTIALSISFVKISTAQSQLEVRCYNSNVYDNAYYINGELMEYGVCFGTPSFYVAVIDPSTCGVWGTNYGGANPDHSFGNETDCRPRVENYFVFQQTDSLQLAGMVNMLQQIPAGHSIIIYTPESYDYAAVNTANSNLTQELSARWSPTVIEGNSIMVLYGEQGVASSYIENTNIADDHITFTHTVCGVMGVAEENALSNFLTKVEGTHLFLNPALTIGQISILDATGKMVPFAKNDHVLTLSQSVSTGVYLFQIEMSGKVYHTKLMLSF